MMRWIITGDDAREAGRPAATYGAELAPVLAPYGVEVTVEPDQTGKGGLIGGTDQKTIYDVEEAVRRVRSAGGDTLADLNQDQGLAPASPGSVSGGSPGRS